MDKISGLPDDVLVKILSSVPTKVAVSTSILSKRWEFLWMWLPRLEYTSFRNLPLHRAPIIESLCLESDSRDCNPEDIRRWIEIAVSRHVRELEISYDSGNEIENIFPSSFYTCKSLVTLKLTWVTLMDVPSMDLYGGGCVFKELEHLNLCVCEDDSSKLLNKFLKDMDSINGLPDDLLVKILSFVPTKVVVSNCVLSKRWEFIWMWLPRLEFITQYVNLHLNPGIRDFIDKKLPLHKASVIESLLLQLFLDSHIKPEDIKRWIDDIAVSRYVRQLEIDCFPEFENLLPSSLFTCKSLVILKLKFMYLLDVPSIVCLPSLKTLQLQNVKFVDGNSLQQLLSGCPFLEDLLVQFYNDHNLREFISQWVTWPVLRDTWSVLRDFINKNLPLHRALIIESLCLELDSRDCNPEDIRRWIEIVVSRHVRELEISYDSKNEIENIFPSSLYTCKSLVTLKLSWVTLMDVPSMVCLPSLKTLQLKYVKLIDEESFQQLLYISPVLEDLSVSCGDDGNMKEFSISILSLQSLSLFIPEDWFLDGYVIDTPSLNYLKLEDWNNTNHYSLIENMPKLREAYIDVRHFLLKGVVESITSVKHLTICSEDIYGDGFVFNQLEHLNLCVCKRDSSNLLGQLLKDSPKLRVLEISEVNDHGDGERNGMVCWNPPSPVPECLLSSLQTFKWSRYFEKPQYRDIAVYILQNARHLKMATILADTEEHLVPNFQMLKELALSPQASTTCQLVFVEDLKDCCEEDEISS